MQLHVFHLKITSNDHIITKLRRGKLDFALRCFYFFRYIRVSCVYALAMWDSAPSNSFSNLHFVLRIKETPVVNHFWGPKKKQIGGASTPDPLPPEQRASPTLDFQSLEQYSIWNPLCKNAGYGPVDK